MKIARALSVRLGKGEVRFWASQERSVVGSDWRGKRAAWLSGPEKSRHKRQESEDCDETCPGVVCGLGLEACSAARSGRDDRGIGGGLPLVTKSLVFCVFDILEGVSVLLPKPIERADLLGGSGRADCGRSGCPDGDRRPGKAGGCPKGLLPSLAPSKEELPDPISSDASSTWGTAGEECVGLRATLTCPFSSCCLFGGRGGNLD